MAFTNNQGKTQSSLADINVTPLVDVVLVLLIIFMVTAPILQSGIEVEVPHTRTVKEITEERLVISINKRPAKCFSATIRSTSTRSAQSIQAEVSRPARAIGVCTCDENVPFGAFATVMDAVKQSGITNVSIVTQPLESNAGRR